jgi:hypothetical protein
VRRSECPLSAIRGVNALQQLIADSLHYLPIIMGASLRLIGKSQPGTADVVGR